MAVSVSVQLEKMLDRFLASQTSEELVENCERTKWFAFIDVLQDEITCNYLCLFYSKFKATQFRHELRITHYLLSRIRPN